MSDLPGNPAHPLFSDIQARALAARASTGPVLLDRVDGGSREMVEEMGKMAKEDVEETVRLAWMWESLTSKKKLKINKLKTSTTS